MAGHPCFPTTYINVLSVESSHPQPSLLSVALNFLTLIIIIIIIYIIRKFKTATSTETQLFPLLLVYMCTRIW